VSIRNKVRQLWKKFKAWVYSILVTLGVVAAALAVQVDFSYVPPSEYVDGTPLPLSEIQETRLYCDGALVATESGSDGSFTTTLSVGTHICYATVVATNGLESDPSNEVVRVVLTDQLPRPPVLNN